MTRMLAALELPLDGFAETGAFKGRTTSGMYGIP
jgi:hypothetical protein